MIRTILSLILITFLSQKALAVTLKEALVQAYKNNPELNAERENLKVSNEDLKISKAEFLPTLTVTGSKSQEKTGELIDQSGDDVSIADVNP